MKQIRKFADKAEQQSNIETYDIDNYLPFLKNRYFVDGNLTHHFHKLYIERSGEPAEIVESLCNDSANSKTQLIGCLGIIFRLRNNLFHGEKWKYQLQGQKKNFVNASAFLRRIIQ